MPTWQSFRCDSCRESKPIPSDSRTPKRISHVSGAKPGSQWLWCQFRSGWFVQIHRIMTNNNIMYIQLSNCGYMWLWLSLLLDVTWLIWIFMCAKSLRGGLAVLFHARSRSVLWQATVEVAKVCKTGFLFRCLWQSCKSVDIFEMCKSCRDLLRLGTKPWLIWWFELDGHTANQAIQAIHVKVRCGPL